MGIQTGGGLVSGIPTGDLINQLMQLEARPKVLMQNRIVQLQAQQAAFLDLNSRLGALRSSAQGFRVNNTFGGMKATSSNADALTATARSGAAAGTYSFVVDRMVTSQQMLSRGFASKDQALGLTTFSVESEKARIERDVKLSNLNGGAGVERGRFSITQDGETKTIDISKAATIGEVVATINQSGIDVRASLVDGSLRLETTPGGTAFTVSNETGSAVATSLGIAGNSAAENGAEAIQSGRLFRLSEQTAISTLNDGNGVFTNANISDTRSDFRVNVGGTIVSVNIGPVYKLEQGDDGDDGEGGGGFKQVEGPAKTIGAVIDRINQALEAAEIDGVQAEINPDGTGLQIRDTTGADREITTLARVNARPGESTLRDLGFADGVSASGTLGGSRVIGGLSTTLARNLNGGRGISGDLVMAARDGVSMTINMNGAQTVEEIIDRINSNTDNAGRLVASVNSTGNGLQIVDTTGATANNLFILGEAAEALGLATGNEGVDRNTVSGSAQRAYITNATALSEFNNGKALNPGKIRFSDATGTKSFTLDVNDSIQTVGQLVNQINSLASGNEVNILAELNENGDGIVIRELVPDGGTPGGLRINVEDETGSVAKLLGIAGRSKGTDEDNFINGSLERVIEFEATDTLEQVVRKLNDAKAGLSVTIINDGGSGNPFRLSIAATRSGVDGRFLLDTNGFDLGLQTLEAGQDARVFFGSSDPAKAILLSSSTNTFDDVITGVSLDLRKVSDDPVTVTVAGDTSAIETNVEAFVKTFNDLIARIDTVTKYDAQAETKGVLLGDQTVLSLRRAMFNAVQSPPDGFTGTFNRLTQVGIRVGAGGKLEFDSDRFRQALAEDPDAVEALFTRRDIADAERQTQLFDDEGNVIGTVNNPDPQISFSALGIIGKIEELADRYASAAGGVLTQKRETFDSQIKLQRDRIAAFDIRLGAKRQILESQFLQMERAIASLQGQQSSLAGIAGLRMGF